MNADPRRWRQLWLLAVAELLGMSVWFAGSAVAPALSARVSMLPGQAAWLTSAVQLGFVFGTLFVAVTNAGDLVPSRRMFVVSAVAASLCNASLLVAGTPAVAIATRALTGIALAGVYPPAMKMAATWFRTERGLAIGSVVGALTFGKALPYLIEGAGHLPLTPAVLLPSAAALAAAACIAVGYCDGPFAFPARPFSWRLVGEVARDARLRTVTAGYLGHMWELYAFWAWIPAFLGASFTARGLSGASARVWAFACVAIGAVGAIAGGVMADRVGRKTVVTASLVCSGACAVSTAVLFGRGRWIIVAVCLIWGIAVIADSAQFSAMVTEIAPAHAVGTALTLQISLGFLLTIASIQLVPRVASITGWRWAMVVLAIGPVAGLFSIRRLAGQRVR